MHFISTNNDDFPYKAVKELYEEYSQYNISGNNLYIDELISLNIFFAVMDNKKFIGCLYLHNFGIDSVYLSGFSKRKQPKANIRAISEFINNITQRYILSSTPHAHAKLCLLRAGFKQIATDLFLYERN